MGIGDLPSPAPAPLSRATAFYHDKVVFRSYLRLWSPLSPLFLPILLPFPPLKQTTQSVSRQVTRIDTDRFATTLNTRQSTMTNGNKENSGFIPRPNAPQSHSALTVVRIRVIGAVRLGRLAVRFIRAVRLLPLLRSGIFFDFLFLGLREKRKVNPGNMSSCPLQPAMSYCTHF